MSGLTDIQCFIDEARAAASFAELDGLLDGATRTLGFRYFALMHHVPDPLALNAPHLSNYPDSWIEAVAERKYWAEDPVATACQSNLASFAWSDLPSLITFTPRQHEILRGAEKAGLGEGFTVPANIPGELSGSVSFGMPPGKSLPRHSLPLAHYLGCFAYEAARRLARKSVTPVAAPALSGRQFDCVILIAKGQSDYEAARALGLSPETVHQHVKTAMKRYGVKSRTQLVVHALFSNNLTYKDILVRTNPIP